MVVGLTMSRRTIAEIKIGTDSEKMKQAFNAAESAIDYYIQTGNKGGVTSTTTRAQVDAKPLNIGSGETLTFTGAVADVDLSSYVGSSSLKVCVKNKSLVRVDYFYQALGQFQVKRNAYFERGKDHPDNFSEYDLDGCFLQNIAGTAKHLKIITINGNAEKISIIPSIGGINQPGAERLTVIGFADKNNAKGVKTQIKADRIFAIPSFLMDGIVAAGEISN